MPLSLWSTGTQRDQELSPRNYPYGAHFLQDEFCWDCTEEGSPFGNDHGADTFDFLQDWRDDHPRGDPVRFLSQLLKRHQMIDAHWDVVDPGEAKRLFEDEEYSFMGQGSAVLLWPNDMNRDCSTYKPIALDRRSVNQRIRETKEIKEGLVFLAAREKWEVELYRCPACSQLWQSHMCNLLR